MAEGVQEKTAARLKPAPDAIEQFPPVSHVFKHLDGNHAVEGLSWYKGIHVCSDDVDVGKATRRSASARMKVP